MFYPYLYISVFLLFGFTPFQLMSQDLTPYRWQNRLIVLVAPNESNDLFQQQLQLLAEDIEGLKERKLLLLTIKDTESQILLPKPRPLKLKEQELERFRTSDQPFSFILIGLDGGIKLRRNELVSREYLYALIDGMPMRRAEMREKRNKNQP